MNKIESSVIKYQIDFEKYKNGYANNVIALFDSANKKISEYVKLTKEISTKKRYTEIAKKLRDISTSLKSKIDSSSNIDAVIEYELKKQKSILKEFIPEIKKIKGLNTNLLYPTKEQIKTAALFKPIDVKTGMTYQSYLDGIESGLYNNWDSALRAGYLTGMPTKKIVEDVIGGVSNKDKLIKQGTINVFRNSIWSNTRTVLQSFANETRNRIYQENEKYFGDLETDYKYEYLATLDARSCLVCGNYDGKLFKTLKECPQIPVHRGCRCVIIPYFGNTDGETRASKDGYIDGKVTFDKWLGEQNEEVQKEVLGKTKFELFKKGEKITQFVDDGKILTLPEISARLNNKENKSKENQEIKKSYAKAEA